MQTLVKNDKTLNPVATLVLQKTQLNTKKFKKQYKIHLPLLQMFSFSNATDNIYGQKLFT